jgi:hypothetical protein
MIYLVDRLRLLSKLTGWALLKLPLSLLSLVVWLGKKLQGLLVFLGLLIWDLGLSLSNVVTARRKKGSGVKEGKAGYKRIWPEFIAPQAGDSRAPCPGLS